MSTPNKWSGAFFRDLGERVAATFLGALLGLFTLTETTQVDWSNEAALWAVLGVPTVVSLIKGLLANLAQPISGASALPAPPVVNEAGYGALGAIGAGLVVLAVIFAVLTLLNVVAQFSWVALVIVLVIGLVLIWVDRGSSGRVL